MTGATTTVEWTSPASSTTRPGRSRLAVSDMDQASAPTCSKWTGWSPVPSPAISTGKALAAAGLTGEITETHRVRKHAISAPSGPKSRWPSVCHSPVELDGPAKQSPVKKSPVVHARGVANTFVFATAPSTLAVATGQKSPS